MNKKKKLAALLKKLDEQTLFFENKFKNIVIRSVPSLGYFIKFKGQKEVFIQRNSIMTDMLLDFHPITEEEYNKY